MSQLFFQDKYYSIYTSEQYIDYIRIKNEVLIIPVTPQNEVILISEFSDALGKPTLILPGGVVEEDETHEQTALRELQEEIGYTARHLNFLGEVHPFSKYIALQSFIYIAHGLVPSKLQGDERYPIFMEKVPLKDFKHLISCGRLFDARVIAALFMACSFLEKGQKKVRKKDNNC